ncbi:MAG TPA: hypothetical protein VFL91_21260 [Thermomicrobiales bacterium]|nr:hypothetical protein [Thermomicrobiales bacterium]
MPVEPIPLPNQPEIDAALAAVRAAQAEYERRWKADETFGPNDPSRMAVEAAGERLVALLPDTFTCPGCGEPLTSIDRRRTHVVEYERLTLYDADWDYGDNETACTDETVETLSCRRCDTELPEALAELLRCKYPM